MGANDQFGGQFTYLFTLLCSPPDAAPYFLLNFFFNLALHSFEIPIVHAFTGDLSESRQSTVTLQELDEGAMEAIVDFFYSGEIDISESNVQELLPVACLLQVQSVQKACCDFLERQLSTENCLGEFLHKSIISDMENILLALKNWPGRV